MMSQPTTPQETGEEHPGINANGVNAGLERVMPSTPGIPAPINTSVPPKPPYSPTSPTIGGGFRRGHSRTASLGTTMTSPSTRRRSLESTMSLIQGVWDGKDGRIPEEDQVVDGLANQLAGSTVGNQGGPGGVGASGTARTPR